MAIVKALSAGFEGKEIKIEELIGKAPYENQNELNDKSISEWKNEAKKRGLFT